MALQHLVETFPTEHVRTSIVKNRMRAATATVRSLCHCDNIAGRLTRKPGDADREQRMEATRQTRHRGEAVLPKRANLKPPNKCIFDGKGGLTKAPHFSRLVEGPYHGKDGSAYSRGWFTFETFVPRTPTPGVLDQDTPKRHLQSQSSKRLRRLQLPVAGRPRALIATYCPCRKHLN